MTKFKSSAVLLVLLLVSSISLKAEDGIHFVHSKWKEVVAQAKAENKVIFVDCYTSWCGPCKKLSAEIFPQKEVGTYFNENFINTKVDCEKGEGPELKDKFGISAFPTMLFIDPSTEKVLHRIVGYVSAEKLIAEAKGAPAEAKRAVLLEENYKKNSKDVKTIEDYLSYLVKISDPRAEEVALNYLQVIPKTDWHKKEYFWVMSRYVKDPFSKEANYFYDNKAKFLEGNGFQGEYFETGLYYNYASKLAEVKTKEAFDQKEFDKLLALMEKNNFDAIDGVKDFTTRTILINVGDYAGYMDIVEVKFEKGMKKSSKYYAEQGFNLLNRLSNCTDKAIFTRAVNLMDLVIANQFDNQELDMFGLSIGYRDRFEYIKKSNIQGERVVVAKEMNDLFVNMVPKHRKLLDKTYAEAQKEKANGNTGGRSIPAMRMGGH